MNSINFHRLVKRLEKKIKIQPIFGLIKNRCISKKYLISENTKGSFKITRGVNIKKLIKCKRSNEILIPVHIRNKIHKSFHFNILVINKRTKTVTRIEPTNDKKTKINRQHFTKEMTKYFNKYGLKYKGFDKRSRFINHHRLCRPK